MNHSASGSLHWGNDGQPNCIKVRQRKVTHVLAQPTNSDFGTRRSHSHRLGSDRGRCWAAAPLTWFRYHRQKKLAEKPSNTWRFFGPNGLRASHRDVEGFILGDSSESKMPTDVPCIDLFSRGTRRVLHVYWYWLRLRKHRQRKG